MSAFAIYANQLQAQYIASSKLWAWDDDFAMLSE